ncbi:hypothetical protein VTL71DRAFT_4722 [Oculimacula yallundae]|uniref:Uncharacterized protein n=1 Tax=Oculimacula yallundae TaxID=86028 RepID=A0ABR4C2Q4_9HELO
MDEASKLVGELQQKLSELDLKVWKYQQDMAAEFEKYTAELLRGVPKDVSETVSKTMAEAMKGCTSLFPAKTGTKSTSAAGTTGIPEKGVGGDTFEQHQTLPSSAALRRPEQDMEDRPRSPHQREKEFEGVFIPSFIPLLDSTSRNERNPSYDYTPTTPPPGYKGKEREDEPSQVDASTDTRSLMNTPEANRPPTPSRKNTDEWSIASDHSDGNRRRSALRRTSTASNKDRGSPRRVRFEVEGVEVLTTSSPQQESILSGENQTGLFSDEEDDEAGSEMIEDVEKPPPKRISSSQALRNLSRSPLVDDGTQWTTVTAPPDGSASVATTNGFSEDSSSEDLTASNGESQSTPRGAFSENGTQNDLSPTNVAMETSDTNEDPENDSDDDEDMLDMPPLRRHSASQSASILSPADPPSIEGNKSPTSATRANKVLLGTDNSGLGSNSRIIDHKLSKSGDDDELFDFDEAIESSNPRARTHRLEDLDPIDPEDVDDEEHESDTADSPTQPSKPANSSASTYPYSSSPARPIIRPNKAPVKGVIGIYDKEPFSMPVVNPDLHAKAAAMGPVDSFVGSVHDGLSESNAQSFRAGVSVGSFSGTPKSMSERLMLEDIMEEEKKKRRRG